MKKWINLSILVLLFIISVSVRFSHIKSSVYSSHGVYVILFTTIEIWEERGITDCYFSPIQTYSNEADKFMTYFPRLVSPEGDNYFVSFPPLSYITGYLAAKLFGMPPVPLPFYIISIILHFISAVFIFLLVNRFYGKNTNTIFLPSLTAFAVYLFVPSVLYLHLSFFPEMLGQTLFIITIYYSYLFVNTPGEKAYRYIILLAILNFVLSYTDWLGIFYAFTILLICTFHYHKDRKYRKLFLSIIVSSAIALFLTLLQYGLIDGVYSLIKSLGLRYACRSGFFPELYSEGGLNIYSSEFYSILIENFYHGLFLFPAFVLLLIVAAFFIKNRKPMKTDIVWLSRRFLIKHHKFLLLILLPVCLNLAVFANNTMMHPHTFARLAIPLAIAIAMCVNYILKDFNMLKVKFIEYSVITVVFIICTCSVFFYHQKYSQFGAGSYMKEVSEIIKNNVSPDEAIFINIVSDHSLPAYYLTFFTKRNMANVLSFKEAKELAENLNKEKGVYFAFNQYTGERSMQYFKLNTDEKAH